MATNSKQFVTNRDNARITGIQKYCATQTSILVAGVAYTPAEAVQIYQSDLDALQAVAQAKSAYKAAVAKAATARAATDTFDSAFKRCIEGAYAGDSAALDVFGVVLGTYTAPSAAVKAEAVAKARAATSAASAPAPAGSGAAPAAKS